MKAVSFAVMALLDSSVAYKLTNKNKAPVRPLSLHWNEDPRSVPDPLVQKPYLTSTQAKYLRDELKDWPREEVKDNHPYFFIPYNHDSPEPTAIQIDGPEDEVTVLWHVSPDYGELDDKVVGREADVDNGKKESGWTNPLGWHDDGTDDDQVVVQLKDDVEDPQEDEDKTLTNLGLSSSGYETPADTGLGDEGVLNFV